MKANLPQSAVGAIALLLLMTACGDTASSAATTPSAPTVTTTMSSSAGGVTVFEDIVYLEMDGHDYLVDIYVPDGEGPWPVVLALHGGTVYKDHSTNTAVAEAAAEAGMVVFAPNWVERWPTGLIIGMEELTAWEATTYCSMAFAQQEATGYGGDPNRTVVYGISAGASSGSHLAVFPTTNLAPGCLAQELPTAPAGAVLGDADYFLHYSFFDQGFDADTEGMQTKGARLIDPDSWPPEISTRFRFWAAEGGSLPREFDDPWDEEGWFALRDPIGTIRRDMEDLGTLDDGAVDYIDQGLLFFTRLQREGIDATFDILPGGHDSRDKVPEIIAYLLEAAGTP